jgi:selenocysteine lyase/cysteine desulfurase
MTESEKHFNVFRENIIGIDHKVITPFGTKNLVYADWVASGRLYKIIEERMINEFAPFVGNTHSETSFTGTLMTRSYHMAHSIIKAHCNANGNDVIINAGFGMTAVVNKFQRLLGLKVCEQISKYTSIPKEDRAIVFITHMEHHSNHTSWLESTADVEVILPNEQGLVDLDHFAVLLEKYKDRKLKIGSFTAASNVTGVQPDYHKMARMIHEYGGYCFIDFAAAAPYVKINMHPDNPLEKLDAIFFSPHKFLGGPGTSGVLIFDKILYNRSIPDHPGGGTVDWTNPWGQYKYVNDIEAREDGGTPGFLQAIKTALSIQLKEEMGVENILKREEELLSIALPELKKIPKLHILAHNIEHRLGIISFYVEDLHYNLICKILNDRFGIQMRGGCSCAGTYGHYLLHVDPNRSKRITDKINKGDLSEKPGWVRLSLHPTMTDNELYYIIDALKQIIKYSNSWSNDYTYSLSTNEFYHYNEPDIDSIYIKKWFGK